jgi:hypothetical protein
MRKLMLLPAGLCLALCWGAVARAQQDDPRAVIDKGIKALGGAEKLAKLTATTVKGKGTVDTAMGKFDFTVEAHTQLPDKVKVSIDLDIMNMKIVVVQVFNGKKGWVRLLEKTMPMEEEQLKEAKNQMHVERVTGLVELKDKAYKLSALGEMKIDGKAAVGVQVTKKGERDVNLWFDAKDHLLLKAEYRALDDMTKQEVNQEKFFREYKDFNGVKGPTKLLVKNDGKDYLDMVVTEMTFVGKHDDSLFGEP